MYELICDSYAAASMYSQAFLDRNRKELVGPKPVIEIENTDVKVEEKNKKKVSTKTALPSKDERKKLHALPSL